MDNNFGHRVKTRRLELKLSQAALAKRVKVSQGTIAQIEIGRNQGSTRIIELAKALDVAPEWLQHGDRYDKGNMSGLPTITQENPDNYLTIENLSIGFKKQFIKQNYWDEKYLAFLHATDESMAPTIGKMDDIMFSKLDVKLQENCIYVIRRLTGVIIIRRTILDSSQNWIYRCDNLDKTRFSDVYSSPDDQILGRVLWRGGIGNLA